MLIWRGLKPAAIVAAMLSVQSEWKKSEQRRAGDRSNGARPNGSQNAPPAPMTEPRRPTGSAAVPRLVPLDGVGAKSGRLLP